MSKYTKLSDLRGCVRRSKSNDKVLVVLPPAVVSMHGTMFTLFVFLTVLIEVVVKNKLLRLVEMLEEDFPEEIVSVFKESKRPPLDECIELMCRARDFYQLRSESLWLQAGKQRTPDERRAAALADLASFLFAYLTGEGREYAESAVAALGVLGRDAETDIIKMLVRR